MRGGITMIGKFISIIALLIFSSFTAFAAPIDSIEQNRDTGEITVKGSMDTDGYFSLQVLGKDKSVSDLIGLPGSQALSVINSVFHFQHTYGEYEVTIMIDGNGESGDYTIRVNSAKLDAPYEKVFDFYDTREIQNILSSIKTSSANDIMDIIEQEETRNILGINIPLYEKLDNRLFVATYIKNNVGSINNVTALKKYFALGCVFSFFNNSNDPKTASVYIDTYKNDLEIADHYLYELFLGFSEMAKEDMCKRLINKNISNNDDFVYKFYEASFLTGIKYPLGNLAVKNLMKDNKEILSNFSLDKYWSLDDTYSVDSRIAGENFATYDRLVEKINSILNTSKSSTGGGGGGGGVTTTLNVTQTSHDESAKIQFTDLESVQWAKEGINYLAKKGIINGKGDGLFAPQDNITREEFVKMLVVAFDIYDEAAQSQFDDAAQNEWYYKYVSSGVKAGLINGVSGNMFGIGEKITRQDMAVLIWRFLNHVGSTLPKSEILGFVDKAHIAEYAIEAIAALREAGIVSGMSDGTYMPNAFCTRAQAAQIIFSALKYVGL